MSYHHAPPRLSRLRTTGLLLKQTTASFTSNPFTFLYLSLLLFSFRALVENGTHQLTNFIDHDASLKSLLSRLDLSGTSRFHHHPRHHMHRNRPFLNLTSVRILYDDFFSGDDDIDLSFFNSIHKRPHNGTVVILSNLGRNLGFFDLIADNGIQSNLGRRWLLVEVKEDDESNFII